MKITIIIEFEENCNSCGYSKYRVYEYYYKYFSREIYNCVIIDDAEHIEVERDIYKCPKCGKTTLKRTFKFK